MQHKPKKILFLVLSLILALSPTLGISTPATAFQVGTEGDSTPPLRAMAQSSSSPDTQASDERFVAEVGEELDQYLFRTDGDGYIKFNIPITRYYFNIGDANIQFDGSGFLRSGAVNYVKNKGILPAKATLKLRVWDVDEEASWCPEVDYVYVNGKRVPASGSQFKLSGINAGWSTPTFTIPIDILKFPQSIGVGGNRPTPAPNEISIQVDASGCVSSGGGGAWAVEVDWGVIEIASPIRPVIFAHGWTGSTTDFDQFEQWMRDDGRQPAGQAFLDGGLRSISETALLLKQAINTRTREFGVDKLNVFAHSKGGLVIRKALDDDAVARQVDRVITMATPHHGTWDAEGDRVEILNIGLINWKCYLDYKLNLVDAWRCDRAAQEFTVDAMRNFNYTGCTKAWPWSPWENCRPNQGRKHPGVTYYSFASKWDEAVIPLESTTYPWNAEVPFPKRINVDQVFDLGLVSHSKIRQHRDVYLAAMNYLSVTNIPSEIYAGAEIDPAEAMAAEPVDSEYQVFLNESGTLNPGTPKSFSAGVQGGTSALFKVKSEQALTYTLLAPDGGVIDPAAANADPNIVYASGFDGDSWIYQYQVTAPAVGAWQNNLSAGAATSFVLSNLTNSAIRLGSKTDKFTYRPGDLVTLETALANDSAPYMGVAFTGTVTHPDDSTENLAFYDDGSHGDITPNNGVYTAQFSALYTNGHALIHLGAAKDSITRITETSIAVASQSAQFQYVSYEYPEDTNANTLYDRLNMETYIYVYESGEFEIQGTLVDGAGQPVANGYYSSRMAETGPLPTGWNAIPLTFDGNEIYQHGVDGPYTLTDLTIFNVTEETLEVDAVHSVYTTSAYPIDQFEHTDIALAGGQEAVLDADDNGLYDWLAVTLNVNVAVPGDYEVNGRLVDPNGSEVTWSSGQFYAPTSGVYPVELWFDGYEIGGHKASGPFTVKDVSISNMNGINYASFSQAYTTQAYSILKFEGVFATFADASTSHWAWNFIERLYSAGITGGCGTNPLQYCPEGTVTRAQMAVFLERGMKGSYYAPPAVGGSTGFSDVAASHWAGAWIKQLAADGITSGCGSGKYCPESPVTRAQMAVFLLKAKYGADYAPPAVGGGSGFSDVPASHWAAAWIKQLAAEDITGGCGTGTYCPEASVTRAQMAVFLVRTFSLP